MLWTWSLLIGDGSNEMIGIFGEYIKVEDVQFSTNKLEKKSFLFSNESIARKLYAGRVSVKKYENDKISFENQHYLIYTDGILLNSTQLKKKYRKQTISDLIITMFEESETFFSQIRGSYSCIIYDKKNDELFVYTDQLADKKIFFFDSNEKFIFSSRMNDIFKRVDKKEVDFDKESCVTLLTLGFMIDDHTLLKQIKKLAAGSFIKVKNNKACVKSYFKFNNDQTNFNSEEQIIEKLDELFRNSVKLQFEKDLEYNYKHIASLSGGLDSRMVNFVASDLGYKEILNYTFSQSGYMDATIAMEIASDLHHQFIFKSLDDANFLYDIDLIGSVSFGSSIYYGIAHSYNCIGVINMNDLGMIHTGQLGDVIVGSFNKSNVKKIDFKNYAYSKKYSSKLDSIDVAPYENDEMFKIYNRGINFALNGNLAFQEYSESASPFCNVDFMQYCLNIPIEKRKDHSLYYKWMNTKYPEATNYKYESTASNINTLKIVVKTKKFVRRIINKMSKVLNLPNLYGYNSKNGMNPFDYWYNSNPDLHEFVNVYFNDNKKLLNFLDNEISEMAVDLFTNGIMVEKLQVLTLLSALKIYDDENE